MSYDAPTVLAFVGQNANQALLSASCGVREMLQPYNFKTEIVDLRAANGLEKTMNILRTRQVIFAFAFAGVGSTLQGKKGNLWEELKIPFLSLMFDHPFYNLGNHAIDTSYVINCYYYRDFYDVQKQYIKSKQPTALLPMAAPQTHPFYADMPWNERDIGALYLKSGVAIGKVVKKFSEASSEVRAIIQDLIPIVCARTDAYLTDLVQARMKDQGALLDDPKNWKAFVFIVRMLDEYVRAWRSTHMVQAIKGVEGVVIIGNGWDHIDKTGCRAIFLPGEAAGKAYQRYRRSKCVINTNPYFRYGAHERIYEAMKTMGCSITDSNDFYAEHFSGLPNFMSFQWSDKDWRGKVRGYIAKAQTEPSDRETGRLRTMELLNPERWISEVIALVKKVRSEASAPVSDYASSV
ncbi:MAG: hypothetical protein GC131_01570 [Alphaproteobacteria bacterium]|nr:hypothetical protein [Alphaproteobacteria bacterium]